MLKLTWLTDSRNVNRAGIIAIKLNDDDSLIGVAWTSGEHDIVLGTARGMAIRFHETDARPTGRNTAGVKGINLAEGDAVVGLVRAERDDARKLLTVTANGHGKCTPLDEYLVHSEDGSTRAQGRGGKGRTDIKTTARNGETVGLLAVSEGDGLILISAGGMIVRISADTVRQTGRGAMGVRMINLQEGDSLAGVARVVDDSEGEDDGATAEGEAPADADASDEA